MRGSLAYFQGIWGYLRLQTPPSQASAHVSPNRQPRLGREQGRGKKRHSHLALLHSHFPSKDAFSAKRLETGLC